MIASILTLISSPAGLATMFRRIKEKLVQGKTRLIIPIAFIAVLKILASLFVYRRLSVLGNFFTPWMEAWGNSGPAQQWVYLFSAQDSGFYVALAKGWYEYPMYVFFPAYPVLCKLIGLVMGDFWIAAFIISFGFGLASLPVFQLIAEDYMQRAEAMASTVLAATFPYVFLFTTISYTESLFLFSSLATWYLYRRDRFIPSIMAATIAALTKTYGITIVIPVAIGLLEKRKFRKLSLLAVPVAALLGWMYYIYQRSGDLFVFSTQQSYWMKLGVQFGWLQHYILPLLNFNVWTFPKFDYLLVSFVIFFGYLAFCVFRVDPKLGAYSLSIFLPLLYMGNFISLPRFFAFIFPIWLVVKTRNVPALAVAVAFFMLNSLLIWYQFILGVWVA